MMKTTCELTKGTKELLIVTSIAILAGLTLLVFNDQGKMPTMIEQEQRMESRRMPDHQLELTGYGNLSMVSGRDLREYLASLGAHEKPQTEKLREWLDAQAKRYNEMSLRESTRSIEQYGKL